MRMRNTDESRARDLYLYTELDILKQCAGLPQAGAVMVAKLIDQNALAERLQSFFDSTSCSMVLSRLKSATRRFNLTFSSSSCFKRLSSDGPSPPYFFFQL